MNSNYYPFLSKTPRTSIMNASPVCIAEPSVFSVRDLHSISGHGFTFDGIARFKAVGEYFERLIAFRATNTAGSGRLCDMGFSANEYSSLLTAAEQTVVNPELLKKLESHQFEQVMVRNLVTNDELLFPAILMSLHSFSDKLDSCFFPIRDSSGSAIHIDRDLAFEAALLEFVERQCTTAMWVSGRCNSVTPYNVELFENEKARYVCSLMSEAGYLNYYDISFIAGVQVIFGEYRAKCADDLIQFSCGCAAETGMNNAVLKSFTEVWQTSLLIPQMMFFDETEYGSGRLKTDFKAANRSNFNLGVSKRPIKLGVAHDIIDKKDAIIKSLSCISSNIFVYEQNVNIHGNELHYFRILSPDFFLHMSPGEGNNNINTWIKKFCSANDMRLEALPFS